MKAILEKVTRPENQSFFYRDNVQPYFTTPWHFHPEVEIILIVQGYGTRYVGDSVNNFYPGDLVITGSNTPHVWSCSPEFSKPESNLVSQAIFIQFKEDFWGESFSDLPEMYKIKHLLNEAKRGIEFSKETRKRLEKYMKEMPSISDMSSLMHLLSILEIMSSTNEYRYLSSPNYKAKSINSLDEHRMEIIYDHVLTNYYRDISLEEVSDMISLTPPSFCRYFKQRTNKSFSTFVNEVRIGNASKLLIENKLSISQICYESGFNHLSNFNRQFKKIKIMTPSEYQRKYWSKSLDQINDN